MSSPRHILLIDDDPRDRELTARALKDEFPDASLTQVTDQDSFEAALAAAEFDAAITDYQLRWNDGLTILRRLLADKPGLPIIMYTGSGTEAICAEAMKTGLSDYVVKDRKHFIRLPAALRAAVGRAEIERELAEKNRQTAEQREELRRINESLEQLVAERTRVAEQRARQLQELAKQLTRAEEQERRNLARILHDDLQQLLAASRMHLSTVASGDREDLANRIETIDEMIAKAIRLSRDLTLQVSPPILYEAGLIPALRWLVGRALEEFELDVEIDCDEDDEPASPEIRVLLYQAVRELLFNVKKHAGVSEVNVAAKIDCFEAADGETAEKFILTVRDDGRGFDVDKVLRSGQSEGFGLFHIGERLRLIGGELQAESEPGRTVVKLISPLDVDDVLPGDALIDAPAAPRDSSDCD